MHCICLGSRHHNFALSSFYHVSALAYYMLLTTLIPFPCQMTPMAYVAFTWNVSCAVTTQVTQVSTFIRQKEIKRNGTQTHFHSLTRKREEEIVMR